MDLSLSGAWLVTVAEPLTSKFAGGLTIRRDGDSVRWCFDGQCAVIDLLPGDRIQATFVDREDVDEVSHRPAFAAYRTHAHYDLDPASCSHMVADMVDFFSGIREPRFRFVEAFVR